MWSILSEYELDYWFDARKQGRGTSSIRDKEANVSKQKCQHDQQSCSVHSSTAAFNQFIF